MKPVFADSSYYLALLSAQDAHHNAAVDWSKSNSRRLVLTEFVLLEVANGLSPVGRRNAFGALLAGIRDDSSVVVVPATSALFQSGVELYLSRSDKSWSLTDCVSFAIMRARGLTDALTADHHFEQAGFRILLK